MGVQGGGVGVDLVQVEEVGVLVVLEDVEAEAAGFVADRSLGVAEAGLSELVGVSVFDANGYEDGDHCMYLMVESWADYINGVEGAHPPTAAL